MTSHFHFLSSLSSAPRAFRVHVLQVSGPLCDVAVCLGFDIPKRCIIFLVVLIVFKYIALYGSSFKKKKLCTILLVAEEIKPPRGHTTSKCHSCSQVGGQTSSLQHCYLIYKVLEPDISPFYKHLLL